MIFGKLISLVLILSTVNGFAADAYTVGLISSLRASKNSYRATSPAEVAQRQSEALKALAYFESVLALSKGQADGWKEILSLNDLRKQLEAGTKADIEALDTIEQRYYQDLEGIENQAVLSLRAAIGRYRDAVYYSTLADGPKQYAQTVEELALWLEKHADQPTAETSYQVGKRLGWLERGGNLTNLVAQVHARYSHPNFRFRITKAYIEDNFKKEIKENSPVDQVIRGAKVDGTAFTQGATHLELVASDQRAVLRVVMNGTMSSTSTARKTEYGPLGRPIYITVPTTGRSVVRVEKEFHIVGDALVPQPARAACTTNSTYEAIHSSAKLRVVKNKIAETAYAEKHLGEAEAARLTEKELRKKADEVPQPESFKKTVDLYNEYLKLPQVRTGNAPLLTTWSSQPEYLQQNLVRRSPYALAAPSLPPLPEKAHHLTVFMHQSEANNLVGPMLGGRWFTDDEIGTTFKMITGYTPKEFRLGSHMPRWSIKYDRIRPIQVEFSNGRATVKFFGDALKVEEEVIKESFSVGATYLIKIHPVHGPEFEREGEMTVSPGEGQKELAAKTAAFLKLKFGDLFPKMLAPDGLVPPDGGTFEDLKSFDITELSAKNGWLVFAFTEDKNRKPTVGKKPEAGK